MDFLINRPDRMENPFKDLPPVETIGTVLSAVFAFGVMLRKWLLRDRSEVVRVKHEERQGNAEERVDATYEGILTYLHTALAEGALERAQIRAELVDCATKHAQCEDAMRGLRSRIEQLERKP